MLPDGFQWQDFIDGPALHLNGHRIATVSPLDDERGVYSVRVCFHPSRHNMHYRFFRTVEGSCRYVEAWAVKWEAELRERYPPGAKFAMVP